MHDLWVLVFIVGIVSHTVGFGVKYPLCSVEESTKGRWLNQSEVTKSEETRSEFQRHYIGDSAQNALSFSQVWIPHSSCALHRFTHSSIRKLVLSIHEPKLKRPPQIALARDIGPRVNRAKLHPPTTQQPEKSRVVHWKFYGDSALRGIYCGIVRILEGSETEGPCLSRTCGGLDEGLFRDPSMPKKRADEPERILGPISYLSKNRPTHLAFFGNRLSMAFTYTLSFDADPRVAEVMSPSDSMKEGDAVIFSSGAWDFDKVARETLAANGYVKTVPPADCHDNVTTEISNNRSSNATRDAMLKLTKEVGKKGVLFIYRNNHYNDRFGPLCADRKLEAALNGSHWRVFDNREVSKEVWWHQAPDGFHFDRANSHTVEQHKQEREAVFAASGVYPGQLEIQLAQLLLFQLLHKQLSKNDSELE